MSNYLKTQFSKNLIKYLKNIIEKDKNLNIHLSNCLNINKKNSKVLKENYSSIIQKYIYFKKNLNIVEEKVFDISSAASATISEYNPFLGNEILNEIKKMNYNVKLTYHDSNSKQKLI